MPELKGDSGRLEGESFSAALTDWSLDELQLHIARIRMPASVWADLRRGEHELQLSSDDELLILKGASVAGAALSYRHGAEVEVRGLELKMKEVLGREPQVQTEEEVQYLRNVKEAYEESSSAVDHLAQADESAKAAMATQLTFGPVRRPERVEEPAESQTVADEEDDDVEPARRSEDRSRFTPDRLGG